jgi:hypothetical protein
MTYDIWHGVAAAAICYLHARGCKRGRRVCLAPLLLRPCEAPALYALRSTTGLTTSSRAYCIYLPAACCLSLCCSLNLLVAYPLSPRSSLRSYAVIRLML